MEARIVAAEMSKILGQPIVVETRGGAGGTIGTNHVVRSKPDGYTLLYPGVTVYTLAPHVSEIPYKQEDLVPIVGISLLANCLVTNVNAPWKTVQEFVEYGKKNPGGIKMGHGGVGGAQHISTEGLAYAAGIKVAQVPYKGSSECLVAVIGGHIHGTMAMHTQAISQFRGGKLRLLAMGFSKRHPDVPDVPTFQEAKIPLQASVTENRLGLFAPKGTPEEVVNKLVEAARKTMATPEVLENFKKIGNIPEFLNQAEFKKALAEQSRQFKDIAERVGMGKK